MVLLMTTVKISSITNRLLKKPQADVFIKKAHSNKKPRELSHSTTYCLLTASLIL